MRWAKATNSYGLQPNTATDGRRALMSTLENCDPSKLLKNCREKSLILLTLGGLLIVIESMMPPAWNEDIELMENQEELDWTDFWLDVDLTEADDLTDRLDSKLDELIEDRAKI